MKLATEKQYSLWILALNRKRALSSSHHKGGVSSTWTYFLLPDYMLKLTEMQTNSVQYLQHLKLPTGVSMQYYMKSLTELRDILKKLGRVVPSNFCKNTPHVPGQIKMERRLFPNCFERLLYLKCNISTSKSLAPKEIQHCIFMS